MKKSRADTGVKHLPTNCEGYVLGCQDWLELLELSPGSTTPGYNDKRATATSAHYVTKITEAGFNIKQSSIDLHLLVLLFCHQLDELVNDTSGKYTGFFLPI